MTRDCGLCPTQMLPAVWPDVTALIEEHGKEWLEVVDLKEIYEGLIADQIDLWLGSDDATLELVMVCGWERHSKKSYYHVMFMGGSGLKEHIKAGLKKVEIYACMNGATEVRLGGREGWERILKPFGYVSRSVELRKNVLTCWRH